jgi:hypothetical protein
VRTYFNKTSGSGIVTGKSGGSGPATKKPEPPKERIQNTPQEATNYIKELDEMGVLGEAKVTKEGHRAYRFLKDCEFKGHMFKKGDYVSRDKLHHEIELFKNEKTHLGSIEPKGGTLYKGPKLGRRLNF